MRLGVGAGKARAVGGSEGIAGSARELSGVESTTRGPGVEGGGKVSPARGEGVMEGEGWSLQARSRPLTRSRSNNREYFFIAKG